MFEIPRVRFFYILMFFAFVGCKQQSPQEMIVKRWKAVDLKGAGRENFLYANKEKQQEMEFTKDGKLFMYSRGALEMNLSYILAADGKSFLLVVSKEKNAMPVRIVSLTKKELAITSKMYNNDTLILKP